MSTQPDNTSLGCRHPRPPLQSPRNNADATCKTESHDWASASYWPLERELSSGADNSLVCVAVKVRAGLPAAVFFVLCTFYGEPMSPVQVRLQDSRSHFHLQFLGNHLVRVFFGAVTLHRHGSFGSTLPLVTAERGHYNGQTNTLKDISFTPITLLLMLTNVIIF